MQHVFVSTIALLAVTLGGCDPGCGSAGLSSPQGTCMGGDACLEDRDCASGFCEDSVCTSTCVAHTDCEAGLYCIAHRGPLVGQGCGRDCAFTESGRAELIEASDGLVCVGNEVMRCEDLEDPARYCSACGCAAGLDCVSQLDGVEDCLGSCACLAPRAVGEDCEFNAQCQSENCSGGDPSFCQVAAGDPCDPTAQRQCAFCEEHNPGEFLCSQSCRGLCGTSYCLGSPEDDQFRCLRNCEHDRFCGPGFFCDFRPDLRVDLDPRAVGAYVCSPGG